jgi:succinate dehydrogenase / fumarate reductase, cytochrome b subunit
MAETRDALLIGRDSEGRLVKRPLSPHLQVYRWQITMTLSILHRATGIALSAGTLLLVWWLVAAATSPEAYATVQRFVGSPIGWILLFGWTLSLFYHLFAGLRHLMWDAGFGFEKREYHMTGQAVVIAAVACTVVAWIVGLAVR